MADRLDERLAGFDAAAMRCLKDWDVPGAAVAVVEKDRLIYAKGYGVCELGKDSPVTPGTRFFIASCTKAFTATTLGLLVDEGKLEWDKPVREYLPWFRLHDPVATERVTVRDALTHRTGLPRHDWMWVTSDAARRDLCARLRYLEPSRDLRAAYQYNNLMYVVAGMIVEEIAGQTWEQFVTARLLQPLGMTSSCLCTELAATDDTGASGHVKYKDKMIPWASLTRLDCRTIGGPAGPAGAIVSNVLDMCQWLRLQMNQGRAGRRRLISEAQLKEIHSPQTVIPGAPGDRELLDSSYAMGWVVQPYRGRRWVAHSGSVCGYNSNISFLPSESIGVVCLTNIGGSPASVALPMMIYDRLLGLERIDWSARRKREARKREAEEKKHRKPAPRVRGTQPSHPLEDYTGDYAHPGYGRVTLALSGARLVLRYHKIAFRLKHYHYDEFRMREHPGGDDDYRVTFRLDSAGKVAAVAIAFEPAVTDIVFGRVATADA